jgi:hypothetical protein
MAEFSINNPNGYLAGPLGSFRVYGADGRLKAIGAGGGGGATWGTITGDILNQTDLINYIASQTGSGFVPETRTLTINGVTYDLSADRTWTLPTGGTVTDVTGTGTVSGLTLTGTGTTSVTLTLGGSLVLVASDITTALGYTPYSDTNPAGFINQTTADGLYYPLSSNPSNYVTSSSLTTILSNYLTTSAAASTYLTITNAATTYQPIFTTQNGLTYGAGVLELGGTLLVDTNIDGASGVYQLNFTDLHSSTNTARESFSFETQDGGNTAQLVLNSQNSKSRFYQVHAATGDESSIELLGTELRVKTPDYTTATNGDVLTLLDNTTGAAEWQTPTGGGGGILHGTASGTDTYTVTITGATAYADGDAYLIRFTNGNTTSATLDINGFGAVDLYRNNDGALIGGDIVDGGEMLCIYNSTTNRFQVIGTAPNTLLGYVTNGESITITKGQAVYAFSGTGDRMVVKLANNTGDATSAQTVGLVLSTSIGANQKGLIMLQGLLDGLNILPDTTWDDGDPVYLGATAGSITKTKPYAPNHLVYLGVVTTASNGNSGRMYVKVQNGYELDELHNVQAQSPTVNDVLYFFGGTPGQWKTASLSTILGYTPQAQLNGTGFVTASGTTISYDNTAYAPLASPAFTGTPTAPTAATGTNTTQIATTAFVQSAAILSANQISIFGDGSNGAGTITGAISLTEDTYYTDLTISGAGAIDLAGYRLFVNGTLDLSNAGSNAISNNGYVGASSTGAIGASNGSAGTFGRGGYGVTTSGYYSGGSGGNVLYRGGNGGTGASANTNNAVAGSQTAQAASPVTGGAGGSGGEGGDSTIGTGAVGGAGQAIAAGTFVVRTFVPNLAFLSRTTQNTTGTIATSQAVGGRHGGGGGGGGSSAVASGGGGGAGGGGGGNTIVYARNIIVGAGTASDAIASRGGNGGSGFSVTFNNTAGSGGAGAGGGGYVYLVYGTITGGSFTFVSANGGTGGNGGNGLGTGTGGQGGQGGSGGRITAICLGNNTITQVNGTGNSGAIPAIPTTTAGSAGGAGGTCTFSS